MARPSNDEREFVSKWEQRIHEALDIRDKWADRFRVDMARKYYEGDQNPGWSTEDWITLNKIYSHLQAQLPLLYSLDPTYYVKVSRSYETDPSAIAMMEKKAQIRQTYLNYLKGELGLKEKARLSIQDTFFEFGVVKIHFKAKSVENPKKGAPMLADDGETPLQGDDGNALMEPDYLQTDERYCVTRIHPSDFIWDAAAGPLDDKWCWMAERVRMTREEAEDDPRIDKAALRDVPPAAKKGEDEGGGLFRSIFKRGADLSKKKKQDDILIGWEVWDLKRGQWFMIMEGAKDPVIKPSEVPKGIEKHPYAILRFTLRDDSPLPIPPVSQAIDPQRELCLSRSRVLRHRKRFNRKYEAVVSMLESEDELAKLETGDDGTVIRSMARGSVSAIQDAPLDPQTYTELGLLNNDLVEAFGTPDQARGIASSDSATEAALLDKRLEVREGDRQSLVVDWLTLIGRKLDQLVQANITRDEAVKIAGPDGEYWQLVRAADFEEINGEFSYKIQVGSTTPRVPQVERAQWLAFLQVLSSFPHLMTSERLMKRMAELHNLEDDQMVADLVKIGKMIMGGQAPMPGQSGPAPGAGTQNPITALLGAAMGSRGGATGGGGAPQLTSVQ